LIGKCLERKFILRVFQETWNTDFRSGLQPLITFAQDVSGCYLFLYRNVLPMKFVTQGGARKTLEIFSKTTSFGKPEATK